MRILDKRDVVSALTTGLTTGVSGWLILRYLGSSLPLGLDPMVLVPLVPVLWLCGVQLGYILATFIKPFAQFGRFAAIGFANAAVDFGVLYLLIAQTGHATGGYYSLFKTISFSVAVIHSYLWNKYWAFDAGRRASSGREVASFFAVSVLSLLINVFAASGTVALGPLGGMDAKAWAGIGAIVGSAVSLIFNFLGLKIFVFRT